MNGPLETIDDRPALRFERRLDHSVERGWRAITEPPELTAFLDGRSPSRDEALEGYPELHERYAGKFGVDPEVGRKAFAEHHQPR